MHCAKYQAGLPASALLDGPPHTPGQRWRFDAESAAASLRAEDDSGSGKEAPTLSDAAGDGLAKLEPLDQEFFSYPHNLTDLLFTYVNRHPEEFGTLAKSDDA